MKRIFVVTILILVSFVAYGYKPYTVELGFGVGSNSTNFVRDGDVKFASWMPGFQAQVNVPISEVVTIGASYFYSPTSRNWGRRTDLQAFGLEVGLITSDYATASIGVETTQPTFNGEKYDRRYHARGTVWFYPFNFNHFGFFASASTSFRVNVGASLKF
jgi:hypothetical protein